ncbi:MAG: hypothetical protein EBT15_04790 [Betaproteobacteria bacterium]|nr:hypothetical protein [Betaproteobacteria bacterium]
MTQRITRMISIGRDNIMQLMQQDNFFAAVPGLMPLKAQFEACRAAYDQSAKDRGCRCRADLNTLNPCLAAFLDTLEAAKENNRELMNQFIQFVAKTPNIETTGVTIYYAPPNGSAPQRYTYP